MNKPVAWTSQDVLDADHIIKAVVRREQDEQHTIPLYTHPAPTKVKFASDSCESGWIYLENVHPVKELTDEEIIEQANHLADGWFSDKFEKGIFITEEKLVALFKAILRKAQEK